MTSYLRRLVGPMRLRWSLQVCHFAAIGPAGMRGSSIDFPSLVIAPTASLRLESHGPQWKTRKANRDYNAERDAQELHRRRVFGVVDPQRLEGALEAVQYVIAQKEAADDV